MTPKVPNPDQWFEDAYGFPRPNWTLIEDWILANADADEFDSAWNTATKNWLRRIEVATSGKYRFAESDSLHLLSPHSDRECATMLKSAEGLYRQIAHSLGSLLVPRFGRIVVLRFCDPTDYYRYVSYFHEDDQEHPMSGGMYFADGYPHIACHSQTFETFCPTFAHELTHLLLGHLRLPAWVNEGLAMTFEPDAGRSHLPDPEAIQKHRAHWNEDTIQAFWAGETFQQSGEVFGLGYGLAAVLFDIIRKELQPPSAALQAFVEDADPSDAGASAAQKHLRVELAELVEVFLGPGNWNPRPGF